MCLRWHKAQIRYRYFCQYSLYDSQEKICKMNDRGSLRILVLAYDSLILMKL